MDWSRERARPITCDEQEALDYIKKLLGEMPDEKIFAFIRIKCATEDGFFIKMIEHAFDGYSTQNDILREDISILSRALFMAERCIPSKKKQRVKFKETFKYAILEGLKIARKFLNIENTIKEYEEN